MKNKPNFPITKLFPNIITLTALCLGLSAIRCALHNKWELAITMIVVAAFLDSLDGRIARLLNATSSFGAQLDSLADFLNFGITPSLTLYLWSLQHTKIKGLGWAIALFFTVCCAIRLARFNTELDSEDRPQWTEGFFVGIPSTIGGFIATTPIMVEIEYGIKLSHHPLILGSFMFCIALLMISRVPTFSSKRIHIKREFVSLTLVLCGLLIAGILIEPWIILPFLALLYLCSIPFSINHYNKISKTIE